MKQIDEIRFETEVQHRKGLDTEDAALRIAGTVVKSLKAEIVQRVIPPKRSNVDECDAIILTDSCIMVLEVKRIGGSIKNFSLDTEMLTVEKGKQVVKIENPIVKLRRRCNALSEYINQDQEWWKLKFLFKLAEIGELIPVVPILCFGPSTDYVYDDIDPNMIVCTTRTFKRSLSNFIVGKKSVVGAYRSAKQIVSNWRIAGKLTVRPIRGFIRAIPIKAFGKIVVFEDVMAIEGKKNGRIVIIYRDKVKKIIKEIRQIVFRVYTNGTWEEVQIDAGRTFSWKAGGE